SSVRTAGIPVGIIKEIQLVDGQARIEFTVKSDIPVTTSALVQIKSVGILGDRHIEVYPGSPTDAPLPNGSQILNVKDQASLDNIIGQVGEIAGSLKDVTANLKEAVTEDGTNKHILGRIVRNIERLTADLSEMTAENKDQIRDIVDQVHNITGTLDELINDQSEAGFKKTWNRTLARIDTTMKNIDEVAGKINRGEGTIGKLVNDESTIDNLNATLENFGGLTETAVRMQTAFDYHAEYLDTVAATKSYIGVQIQPGPDRFYYVAIVDDPAGVVDITDSKTTTPGGSLIEESRNRKVYHSKTKFTALFGMNFYDATVRAGLFENTGGLGLDYNFFRKKLRLSVEAFDFQKTNLRAYARYNLGYGFYVLGGMNDMMDKNDVRSGYLGAGIFLTNDDL
ncbi:MAG: MlaD family protein, partial [Bdellovibrionota bacterium]